MTGGIFQQDTAILPYEELKNSKRYHTLAVFHITGKLTRFPCDMKLL